MPAESVASQAAIQQAEDQPDIQPSLPHPPISPTDEKAHRPARPEPAEVDDDLAAARDAILAATPEALVKGRPIPWQAGQLSGYVVPSDREDYDDQVCRNIYASILDGGHERKSQAQRWCRPEDEDGWAPE